MANPKTGGAKPSTPFYRQQGFHLFLMLLPFLILIFLLNYLPLRGWFFTLFNYKPGVPLSSDNFVGLENFRKLIANEYQMKQLGQVLKNTFGISGLSVLALPLPMFFAILLSELRFSPFKKAVQTLTTIPNFISWVLVYTAAYSAFSVGDGFVNRLLVSLGITETGIAFMASPDHVWLTMIGYYLWKSLGWSAIMYFASMAGIDQELYEAADVDGAGRFARIRYITIPSLLPTLFVMFVINIANFVNYGMEQPYVFQNIMNRDTIQTLDLFVYNQGIAGRNYANSIIVGMLKSFVSLALLFGANSLSKLVRKESVF